MSKVEAILTDIDKNLTAVLVNSTAISVKQDSMLKSQDKMFYGLLGIITAQIGVKILGTDPLLDIATIIGLIATFLCVGILINYTKKIKDGYKLTLSGKVFLLFMVITIIVQILVYLRDLQVGLITPRLVYGIRILMNVTLFILAWTLFEHHNFVIKRLFCDFWLVLCQISYGKR